MAQMVLAADKREIGWSALALGLTALAFKGAAWSYPQGAGTIWLVGAATLVAVGLLGARDVWRVRRDGDAA
ncbi:hypothetical protein ASE95_14370 [Sphingomonas sp. Leaf231]|uniref:hypothetical protein n=1 Tax=Sphingomonas sp. Leaf231 TaxID=1736301 RepID=UPI0006FB0023|nr:hypothetical protein [Sphingomonas sp. Leaf231]KQN90634.1 hypothetical protein ASE95_14370 [Sphingomonas sp. Leaf231]